MRTLDRSRVEPLVLLPFDGPLADDLRALAVEVLTGPLAVVRRERLSPAGLARLASETVGARRPLARLVADRGIDVVHANTSVILGLRAVAPRLVVHVREIYPRVPVAWPALRRELRKAAALVCVSEATRAALDAPDARVIHDGLAVDATRAPKAEARETLDLPQDAFVAAFLGRLSPWKGQEVLANALTLPALTDAVGLFAGDAWPGNERFVEELRAHENVRLVGFRPDTDNVFGAADVVVIPSTKPDPLPNSALEAAAAGCCVVAADHGGLPEIIRDGETGRLVAPGDPEALAQVLAELRDDPAQRERLGTAAAQDVRARFPPGGPAAALTQLYAAL